jgi:hypothetical protein
MRYIHRLLCRKRRGRMEGEEEKEEKEGEKEEEDIMVFTCD